MARPVVSPYAERLYSRLLPLAEHDEAYDWPLLKLVNAMSISIADVDEWSSDRADQPGWHVILDAEEAPALFLPWLGQLVGVKMDARLPNETEEAWVARMRVKIASVSGFKRGTPASIVATVQTYLTGSKEVILLERDTSPYHFTVRSRESETLLADVPKIEAAILAAKPAGLQFVYERVPDWTYDDLDAAYPTYDAIDAAFATYDDIDSNNP